jgi:predicted GIY-YIG superfamily endonuclease
MFNNFVYVIKGINQSNKIKYYIGYTNNLFRRIRQHNHEIKGGAKATRGYKWSYCCIITHFKTNIDGLQIEWRLKHNTKKYNIIDKINGFFKYVDLNYRPSPNSLRLKYKLFMYINLDLFNPIHKQYLNLNPLNVLIFKTQFNPYIIDHIVFNN